MEFYESPYFIILVPSVVIAVIFLFFWLFMKETLYDEALAKQKRDQKLLPSKTDKKKAEKKKSKKKEAQNGNLHESDSESTPRDFRLSDAMGSEEEHIVPLPLNVTEAPSSLRERKKKEKKHKGNSEELVPKELESSKPAGKKVEPVPVTKQPTPPSDSAGSKKKPGQKKQKNGIDDQDAKSDSLLSTSRKQDPLILHHEIKQESSSGKKKVSAKKQKTDNVMTLVDEPLIRATTYIPLMDNADSGVTEGKREAADLVRHDGLEGLQKTSVKKLKNETDKENADVKFKDFILVMKNMIFTEEEAMNVVELLKEKSNAMQEILQKASKGDPAAVLHQLQEKDKLLMAAKEEGAVAKEQCKQLSQELMTEKERSNLVMAKMRERVNTLEKEHGVFQNKIHGSYQESQQMKMKFQQIREQMEAEISRLKQENGILRDAVSTSTNQMESKQSSELSKLRQDCARLVNELTEKNNKLQQEELLKKNAEQGINQLKAQQQEAERRWEEMQSYLRKRTAEHEAAQQDVQNKLVTKDNEIQSLHSKLTDTMVSKQQLEQRMMQLMEAEQKRVTTEDSIQRQVQELMEQNEALKAQLQKFHSQMAVQNSASALAEELHKVIAEKDQQINQSEESLANERLKLTSKEEDLMVVQNINMSLKAEVQKLQAITNDQVVTIRELERIQKSVHVKDDKIRTLEDQLQGHYSKASDAKEELQDLEDQNKTFRLEIQKLQAVLSEQANKELLEQLERSITDKDDKIKTVEELLETGLIEMANKEDELKALRTENLSLKSEVESLRKVQNEQVSFASVVDDLQRVISEKDGKIKSVEELLQAEVLKVATKEKTLGALEQEIEAVKEELRKAQLEKDTQVTFVQEVEDLQKQLKEKEERVKSLEVLLKEKESEISKNVECLQVSVAASIKDHEAILREKQEEVQEMATLLDERGKEVAHQRKELQAVQEENRLLRAQIQEIKQENGKQESLVIRIEQLSQLISGKEQENTSLQNELGSLKLAVEQQRQKNNDLRKKNWKAMEALASTEKLLQDRVNKTAKESQQHAEAVEAEMRNILQKLFPIVSLPSSLSHSEWMRGFEKAVREHTKETTRPDDIKVMEQKLKEADELHVMLQQECEKYKVVLAETEGILQRLQRSVEEEESKWKIKIEESQKELQQLKKEQEHLEHELEKAEIERSTYVSEVRELKDLLTELQRKLDDSYSEAVRQNEELTLLKTQLNETSSKLLTDLNERHQLAADLPKAQESLVILEREIGKTSRAPEVIQNSDVCSQTADPDNVNLIQDIVHLKQLLASVGQMLTKGKEQYQLLE
ncbi:PREDICTED: coiled-coil domain-containing protein 175 [Thamnophis sirtalis]|uniref:Coiled-coil domain-containing protein 175 n=1 Tax=Thamnophis sirtalis TaxID=35019 RepID=A0A6I9XD58_9SAUR|nr:PREDICTED: coiled-coil domain-containing protein 175 [Thamnophis sirtalis]